MKKNTLIKICYISSIILLILGLIMTIFSLVIILPSFTPGALIVPGICFIIAIIGLLGMIYYRKQL